VQENVAGLNDLLQLLGRHSVESNTIVVTKIDGGIPVRVGCDERLQLLDRLRVAEVIELNRVLLRVEIAHALSADARSEHEMIAISPSD
jgi:hypothetical protein